MGALKRRTIIMIMIIIIIMPCNYFYRNACVCAGHDSDFDASRQARFPYTCAPFSGYEGANPNHTGSFFGFGFGNGYHYDPAVDNPEYIISDGIRTAAAGAMILGAGSVCGDAIKGVGHMAYPYLFSSNARCDDDQSRAANAAEHTRNRHDHS